MAEIPSFATNPFFITADMLMPPWADPNAVIRFNRFLVGMGLKCGAVMSEEDVGALVESLSEEGITVNENMSLAEGISQTNKQVGKAASKQLTALSEGMDNYSVGRAAKMTGRSIGAAAEAATKPFSNLADKAKVATTIGGEAGVEMAKAEKQMAKANKAGEKLIKLEEQNKQSAARQAKNTSMISKLEEQISNAEDGVDTSALEKQKKLLETRNVVEQNATNSRLEDMASHKNTIENANHTVQKFKSNHMDTMKTEATDLAGSRKRIDKFEQNQKLLSEHNNTINNLSDLEAPVATEGALVETAKAETVKTETPTTEAVDTTKLADAKAAAAAANDTTTVPPVVADPIKGPLPNVPEAELFHGTGRVFSEQVVEGAKEGAREATTSTLTNEEAAQRKADTARTKNAKQHIDQIREDAVKKAEDTTTQMEKEMEKIEKRRQLQREVAQKATQEEQREDTMRKQFEELKEKYENESADYPNKILRHAINDYTNEPIDIQIKALEYALRNSNLPNVNQTLRNVAKKKLKELKNNNKKQSGGTKTKEESKTDLKMLIENSLTKANKQINQQIDSKKDIQHPDFPVYSLELTSEELEKNGMFYTECYEQDKQCNDKDKKHFEDVLKSFENNELRKKEEKVRPKHLFHEKRLQQIESVFENLSTKEHQIEMHDIMVNLFEALKKKHPKQQVAYLLNSGIRKGSEIGIKLLHTYQALHNIDHKGKLNPSDKHEYFKTMMAIIFVPMCPFVELSKLLDMKEDINKDFYNLIHYNKTLILTIVQKFYDPHMNTSTKKEKDRDIARESEMNHKALIKKFKQNPNSKEIQDRVIDSLYDEFKLGNSELCDPWKFLTQDIEIDINVLITQCKQAHKHGIISMDNKNIPSSFKKGIDILNAMFGINKQNKGIWCAYLDKVEVFIGVEKSQQQKIFETVIKNYTSTTNTKNLDDSLKANKLETKSVEELKNNSVDFLRQVTELMNVDSLQNSLDNDYSIFILERLLKYITTQIISVYDKLLKLGKIEGKHDDGDYHLMLTSIKDYFVFYMQDIESLTENIRFRFSLYQTLHPIREDEEKLKEFIGKTQEGGRKQIGGSNSIELQLKEQLEDANNKLALLQQQEEQLKLMRGGLRKTRRFTRKQKGGNLSSSLKQYAHKTELNQSKHQTNDTNENISDANSKSKEGGKIDKNTVEHFSKIQQLESELTNNKFETYKQMEKTYKQLVQLKNEELKKASESCLHKQLMHKVKNLTCEKDCLRQLQTDPTNNKIKCACKSMPKPFEYKNC